MYSLTAKRNSNKLSMKHSIDGLNPMNSYINFAPLKENFNVVYYNRFGLLTVF